MNQARSPANRKPVSRTTEAARRAASMKTVSYFRYAI
jgi:hypothetical protein